MLPLSSFKYDVVWYWKHGAWMPADPNVSQSLGGCAGNVDALVTRLERAGYRAVKGTRDAGPPEGAPRTLSTKLTTLEMRDVAIPEHDCATNLDQDNYCVLCGENWAARFKLQGPISEIMGLRR